MAKKNTRPAKKAASQEKKPAAAKKTAARKTAAKKVAPGKPTAPAGKAAAQTGPAPRTPVAAGELSRPAAGREASPHSSAGPTPPTTISAKVDIGFGNILYIRGEGPGLSWERGVPMDCVAADEWIWRTRSASGAFICKVLINDEIWSTGEDFHVPPGERLVCYPTF